MSTTVTELCRTLREASYAQRLVEKCGLRLRTGMTQENRLHNTDLRCIQGFSATTL